MEEFVVTCSAVELALSLTVSPVFFASFAPCFSASVAGDEASGFELAYDIVTHLQIRQMQA